MATLTVRNLEDDVVSQLRVRAAEHGRSAEAEHREILHAAVAGDDQLAARRQAADRLADFRRRTARRGPACATELLSEARSGRLRALNSLQALVGRQVVARDRIIHTVVYFVAYTKDHGIIEVISIRFADADERAIFFR